MTLKASNTQETLKPKEVNFLDLGWPGGVPEPETIEQNEELDRKQLIEDIERLEKELEPEDDDPEEAKIFEIINILEELTTRIERLEDRVDSILDRVAIYNTKSSHKI